MKTNRVRSLLLPGAGLLAAAAPSSASACAVCQGAAGDPLMDGLKWGVFSLLLVVTAVLGGFAAFFIYLARRASKVIVPVPGEAALGLATEPAKA